VSTGGSRGRPREPHTQAHVSVIPSGGFDPIAALLAVALVLSFIAAALWTAPRWLVPRIAARSPRCLYAVQTRERVVALTIDDGPEPAHTPAILRVLADHDARATFFLISGNVAGAETIVEDVVARRHELGNHLTREQPSVRLATPAFVSSIREAGSVLSRFGPVRWLRPGSGWYNDTMLDAIEREGYHCALGSVYPYDGRGMPARIATAYILANTRPGAVIILHEGKGRGARTVTVLSRVLPALRARGYRVVTLSELHDRSRVAADGSVAHVERDARRGYPKRDDDG